MILLKGYSLANQRVDFSIGSCPVLADEDCIALVGEKGSPLLQDGTIVRGNAESKVFEGDLVYEGEKLLGTVVYVKGFFMQDLEGTLKKIPEGEHIEVKEGTINSIKTAVNYSERSSMLLSYKDVIFPLSSLMFKMDDFLIVSKFENCLIKPDNIMFSTGCLKSDGKPLCYGEFYKGGIVTLHNNMPCIKVGENDFVEFKEDNLVN